MNKYKNIYKYYESCYDKYGDSAKGVDWPNEIDTQKRHKIMLDLIKYSNNYPGDISLLDFGAGCGHLKDYIDANNLSNIEYSALDISKKYCDVIKSKYPSIDIYNLDILEETNMRLLPRFDFIVMNGVFTEKRELTEDEMWKFFTSLLDNIFKKTDKGIAFNLMSPIADWKDENLFYVSYDKLAHFLKTNLTRNYVINQSYGLWEYTVYVFKTPL